MTLSKENVKLEYDTLKPKLERLASACHDQLEKIFKDNEIEILDIPFRIKKFDSFWEKIQKKGYTSPFDEVTDLCGLRIICFYPSQIDIISEFIENEFFILEVDDKRKTLDYNQFGYLSKHYVIKLKQNWLEIPTLRDLGNIKIEIQIRTILMHAWADISHKLAYKKLHHIPKKFLRRLNQLIALFEIADERFDNLKSERENYIRDVASDIEKIKIQELNLDSLQAILDFYFPERIRDLNGTMELLEDLLKHKINIEKLIGTYLQLKDKLDSILNIFDSRSSIGSLEQVGAMRVVLEISIDDYYNSPIREKIRNLDDDNSRLWKEMIETGKNLSL
ncbi:MAG: GTP pyrophosphokinase [Promethearchaeota archaeon]